MLWAGAEGVVVLLQNFAYEQLLPGQAVYVDLPTGTVTPLIDLSAYTTGDM